MKKEGFIKVDILSLTNLKIKYENREKLSWQGNLSAFR